MSSFFGNSNATTSKGGNANTAKGGKTPKASTSNLLKVALSNNPYELLSKEFDTAFEETSENDVEKEGTGMSKST